MTKVLGYLSRFSARMPIAPGVTPSMDHGPRDRRLMIRTAAAMYGGAAFVGLVEGLLPGGPSFSLVPGVVALVVVSVLVWLGARLPRSLLAPLGPLGVALIAIALATSPGPGDGAVLYVWPVLWTSYFFGTAGAVGIVAAVAVAHAAVLFALPSTSSYPARWVDVMTSVTMVAVVVRVLANRSNELLRRLAGEARTDALSGLLNRRGFAERAEVEMARARRDGLTVAAVSFDIDRFKTINDAWGHDVGDQVIAHLSSVLSSQARKVDLVARVGGEEFVALLVGPGNNGAWEFSERVRHTLATETPATLPRYTVSAGAAAEVAPADLTALLARADAALYQAKDAGRDRTVDVGQANHAPCNDEGPSTAAISIQPALPSIRNVPTPTQ